MLKEIKIDLNLIIDESLFKGISTSDFEKNITESIEKLTKANQAKCQINKLTFNDLNID